MRKKIIYTLIILLFFTGCTDKEVARELLIKEGYSDITITGYSFFGCSQNDIKSTGFTAKKGGITFKGAVCTSMLLEKNTIEIKEIFR